jgi:AcrR family transcriptional regulator
VRGGPSKQQRYEELLDAAAKVFAANGYPASTIQQIAAELQITSAALYYYVDSKEDLFYEICRRAGEQLLLMLHEVIALDVPPERKLEQFMHRHLQVIVGNKPVFEVLVLQRSQIPPNRREALVADERNYVHTIVRLLQEYEPGRLAVDDLNVVALALLAMLNGVLRWYRPEGKLTLDEIADRNYRIFTQGLIAAPVPAM